MEFVGAESCGLVGGHGSPELSIDEYRDIPGGAILVCNVKPAVTQPHNEQAEGDESKDSQPAAYYQEG